MYKLDCINFKSNLKNADTANVIKLIRTVGLQYVSQKI